MIIAIAIIVFLASCVGIGIMVANKLPVLSSLKVRDERYELVSRAKHALLEQRLKRDAARTLQGFRKRFMPVLGALRERWHAVRVWAEEVERRYQYHLTIEQQQHAALPPTAEQHIADAERLLVAGDDEGAERALLKAVALDQQSIPAYKVLSRLYAERKEYDHAREVDEFLLKLDPHQADVYASLSSALVALGESDLALDAIAKAALIEEGNPRYLDQLIELAILRKHKTLAVETLEKLKETNPENEKTSLFAERIHALQGSARAPASSPHPPL